MTDKEVQALADRLFEAMAQQLNIVQVYGPLTATDARAALAAAMAETVGVPSLAIVWNEPDGLKVNLAAQR